MTPSADCRSALREVKAELRGAEPDLPYHVDAITLGPGDAFTFTTDIGWIDIIASPAGVAGYDELERTAEAMELFGQRVLVASVDDLIRMKAGSRTPQGSPGAPGDRRAAGRARSPEALTAPSGT